MDFRFCNANGDTIFIGKDDKGKVVGVDVIDSYQTDLINNFTDLDTQVKMFKNGICNTLIYLHFSIVKPKVANWGKIFTMKSLNHCATNLGLSDLCIEQKWSLLLEYSFFCLFQNQKQISQLLNLIEELQNSTLPNRIELIKNRIEHTESKINALVYQLYELTEAEIHLIEERG